MKKTLTTLFLALSVSFSFAQKVGINNLDPQTALDIQGRLRMRTIILDVSSGTNTTTEDRGFYTFFGAPPSTFTANIPFAALKGTHLFLENLSNQPGNIPNITTLQPSETKFLVKGNGVWLTIYSNLSGNISQINDADGNTKVMTEKNANEDKIRFDLGGTEKMVLFNGPNNTSHLKLTDPGHNIFIGENVAANSGVISDVWAPYPTNAYNVALGFEAMRDNNTTGNTIAIGYRALSKMGNNINHGAGEGLANTAVGDRALENNISGSSNTALGAGTLLNNTASFNVAVGSASMAANTLGAINTAIGHESLEANTEGSQNTALGHAALNKNSIGNYNVAVGESALWYNRTGNENVAIGYKALQQHPSDLADNPLLAASRNGIVAVGAHALENNGKGATFPEDGTENTALGFSSLLSNNIGSYNTSAGYNSLRILEAGYGNTSIGNNSMGSSTTGSYNTSLGTYALFLNKGNENIGIGAASMQIHETGESNIGIGYGTLISHKTGSQNIAIGSYTLSVNLAGSGNIAIGNNAGFNEIGSNKLYIENSKADKNNALIYGEFDNNVLQLNAKTTVNGFTKLGGTGTDVPAVKMKKITGTSPDIDVFQGYTHGLNASKILSVSILVAWLGTAETVPPKYINSVGLEYEYQVTATQVLIINKVGNSANIKLKPFRMLITYEE